MRIHEYGPRSVFECFHCFQRKLHFCYVITAAGVVSCSGPKTSPRTSSIVQIIFYCWPFEINGNILRIQKVSFMSRTIYTRKLFVFDPNLECLEPYIHVLDSILF